MKSHQQKSGKAAKPSLPTSLASVKVNQSRKATQRSMTPTIYHDLAIALIGSSLDVRYGHRAS